MNKEKSAIRFCEKYPNWNRLSDLGNSDIVSIGDKHVIYAYITANKKFFNNLSKIPQNMDYEIIFKISKS